MKINRYSLTLPPVPCSLFPCFIKNRCATDCTTDEIRRLDTVLISDYLYSALLPTAYSLLPLYLFISARLLCTLPPNKDTLVCLPLWFTVSELPEKLTRGFSLSASFTNLSASFSSFIKISYVVVRQRKYRLAHYLHPALKN